MNREGATKKGFLGVSTPELYDTGYVDALVIADCGYTGFGSHSFEGLVANPANGVRFIDTSPQQGPYR